MSLLELIPIGTVVGLLIDQVSITARAVNDVLIEKESFGTLSKYLKDIERVLKELQLQGLNDSQDARQALEFLKEDVKKAKDLVDKYNNRPRFYLLVNCRKIVKEIQAVTRDIGKALAVLSFASTKVLSNISEQVNRLHGEMQKAEFVASQSQLRIVEKLDLGIREQKSDQSFANNMLIEIAMAVGVPIEPSEICGELASLKMEKEEAVSRKEREEAKFLEQVIQILSLADAAKDQEEIRNHYHLRMKAIGNHTTEEEFPVWRAFKCPIMKEVMVDPVSLCTGTTCERAAIEAWLEQNNTDPITKQVLENSILRPNFQVRQSIEEWKERNYCLQIRSAKRKLLSGSDPAHAFYRLQKVVKENPINKDWIAIEGLISIVLTVGSSHDRDLKREALLTLMAIIKGHGRNKDRVVEAGGLDQIVVCLGRDTDTSKVAVELLFELLYDGSRWNDSVCLKLKRQNSAIFFLVMLLKGTVVEAVEKAETILLKLCKDDDDTISCVAANNWYKPFIDRLCHGPELSRIYLVRVLTEMELVDQNIKLLGEEGIIPPLVEIASGTLVSKDLAFSALAKLSSCKENKRLIAASGGVTLILEQMFSSHAHSIIADKCFEILDKLTSNDGVEFLVDANNEDLEIGSIMANLISLLGNPNSTNSIRKPALHALLNICKSAEILTGRMDVSINSIIVLPLLQDPDAEIRELALKLIHHFSQHEPDGITEFLLVDRRLDAFIGFLEDDTKHDTQLAAVGLLSYLPKSKVVLTKKLLDLDILPILLRMLRTGNMETKENVLGVLFRFMDPDNIEMQRMVVHRGVYPLLVNLLNSGSLTAKARAAALIGNLSLSSLKLSVPPSRIGCWCFRSAPSPKCEVHGGLCDVDTTFCLLKANALPELVKLLEEHDAVTTYEALQTLGTLVPEGLTYRGAKVLHDESGINPILNILIWGTPALKEKALEILERVFHAREIGEYYCAAARIHLIGLSVQSSENRHLRIKAASVLAELEPYSKSGSISL